MTKDKIIIKNAKSSPTTSTTTRGSFREIPQTYVSAETDAIWKKFLETEDSTKKPTEEPKMSSSTISFTISTTIQTEEVNQSGTSVTKSLDLMLSNYNETTHPSTLALRNFSDTETNINATRRQMNYKDKDAVEKMKSWAVKKRERDEREEGIGDPYWDKGDWVFLRTASPTTPSVKQDGQTTTFNPMAVHRECDRTCNYYYKLYGKVCGHRYNTRQWRNEYQNFANICYLEHANCVERNKSWHPMHKGKCGELEKFIEHPRGQPAGIVERKKKWDPYEYKSRVITKRTQKPYKPYKP